MIFIVAKAVTEMLSSATDIAGRANQVFIVGKGLSNAGVQMLGEKLAKMTIGEIKAMLDLRNLDPVVVIELFGQLKELSRSLVCIVMNHLELIYFLTSSINLRKDALNLH